MIRYQRLSRPLFSLLLLGCQALAQAPVPTSSPALEPQNVTAAETIQVTLDAPPLLRCPAGQDCNNKPDYLALLWQIDGAEVYLSFSGDLVPGARDLTNLNQYFNYADIYLPQPNGRVMAIHAAPDAKAEAQLHFLPSSAGRLHAQLLVKQHRLQKEGKPGDAACQTDDMQGICRRETTVNTPRTLVLNLAWPIQ